MNDQVNRTFKDNMSDMPKQSPVTCRHDQKALKRGEHGGVYEVCMACGATLRQVLSRCEEANVF